VAASLGRLGRQAGPVAAPAPWAWAYPMRSSAGHAGHLVVAADAEPSAEERFILHALAQQAGVVLVNAQLQADERAAAMRALQRRSAELERSNAELERAERSAVAAPPAPSPPPTGDARAPAAGRPAGG
jgi:hypothetical protein